MCMEKPKRPIIEIDLRPRPEPMDGTVYMGIQLFELSKKIMRPITNVWQNR